ncbi:MAG: hypothetical protein EOP39_32785 [Rubrivivax sp.]|nr:MAG: hypothetical protein EOP39_32785 [Rubrivivax sp.]
MFEDNFRNIENRPWRRTPAPTRLSANAPGSQRRTSGKQRHAQGQFQAGDIAATRTPGGQLS